MTVLSLTFKVLCSRLDNRLEAIEFLFELVAEIYGSALNKKKKKHSNFRNNYERLRISHFNESGNCSVKKFYIDLESIWSVSANEQVIHIFRYIKRRINIRKERRREEKRRRYSKIATVGVVSTV